MISQKSTERSITGVDKCRCRGEIVTALSVTGIAERVCSKCGAVEENVASAIDYVIPYGRSPTSSLVNGGGIGTNFATRNPDGSSESYKLHGNNGQYKEATLHTIQRWDLQQIIEPDSQIRSIQMRLTQKGLKRRMSETELSLAGEPIMAEVRRLKKQRKKMMVDGPESRDIVMEGRATLKDWLETLLTSLESRKRMS